jgi:hypothetical protein
VSKQVNTELLAALKAFASCPIVRATERAEREYPWPDSRVLMGLDDWHLTVGMVRAARAAIAKAEGKP